jgi:hypothetical protein
MESAVNLFADESRADIRRTFGTLVQIPGQRGRGVRKTRLAVVTIGFRLSD